MMLTISNWILLAILAAGGVVIVACFSDSLFDTRPRRTAGIAAVLAIIVVLVAIGLSRHNGNTAAGARVYKDYQSNLSNGVERKLSIVANDGSIVFEHEGKFDVEMNDDYVVYDENGLRTIIYKSYTTSIIIIETN